MSTEHNTELMEALKEWADDFRKKRHPASLTLYRAIQHIEGKWIKATEINRPGGWYWTRLGSDDESCPCVVFVTMDNDGDSAPDFRVVWNGESERTAKRLSHYADKGWEFMEIPMPETLLLGVERCENPESSRSLPPVAIQPYQRTIVDGLQSTDRFRLPMGRIKSPQNASVESRQ